MAKKWILRELLHKYLPKNLIDRPKMGFCKFSGEWLRGPLKEWLYDLLNEDQIKREGIFDHKPIKEKLNEHFAAKEIGRMSFGASQCFRLG